MRSLVQDFASAALDRAFHPLGCKGDKSPITVRSATNDRIPTPAEVKGWSCPKVGLVCGNEVNPVLAIDFDQAGLFFDAYKAKVIAERPELWARLTIERSMNGGYHIWIRTKRPYMTQKLAHNVIEVEGPGEFKSCGKDYKSFEYRGKWIINPDAIETRGATKGMGSYCVCAPSPGYELLQGKILSMPLLEDEEVDYLLSLAREFETYFPEPKEPRLKREVRAADGDRPGDDFNARGEILPILEKHGWTVSKEVGDRLHLARPGKTGGTSATLTDERIFYPFSSNSHPFETDKAYSPFSVYALLEHDGDFAEAARDLAAQGYGDRDGESDWNIESGQRATSTPSSSAVVLRADTIQPEAISWIWDGYIASGKLHVWGGAPGTGKTTLAFSISGTVSRGGRYPDGSLSRRGSVLIWSGEDDPADTIVPRLTAAGADLSKVHILSGMTNGTETRPFDPAQDMAELVRVVHNIGDVRLIVVDPIVSAVQGDSHKNAEVRRSLQPLVTLGAETDAAILGITHFSKGSQGRDATERIVGSIAFAALARVVMVAAKRQDTDQGAARVFLRAKSNIGSDQGGFGYDLEQIELERFPGVYASRVVWREAIDGSATEILTQAEAPDDGQDGALSEAEEFIREMLADGPVPAKDMQASAREAGVSTTTLKRAKKKMGVVSERVPGSTTAWTWALPSGSTGSSAKSSSSTQNNMVPLTPLIPLGNGVGSQPSQEDQESKRIKNITWGNDAPLADHFGTFVEVTI